MQTNPSSVIDTYSPPASADVDIDLAAWGIVFDRHPLGNMTVTPSGVGGSSTTKYAKKRAKQLDAVTLTDYCLERLAEVRRINELSHTPSAVSCLMSFIGFLSSLVYEGEKDIDAYPPFVHDYIKEMYCARIVEKPKCSQPRKTGHPNDNSWGEVIYSMLRCGLVHNMNASGNKALGQDQIQVVLTHEPFHGKDYRLYKFGSYARPKYVAENNESVVLVFNVFDLCDAVRKAVIRMFQKKKVQNTAKRVLAQRPIIQKIY